MPESKYLWKTLRRQLPSDGELITVWQGRPNKWPSNTSEFERNEIAQISFGRLVECEKGVLPLPKGKIAWSRTTAEWVLKMARRKALSPGISAIDEGILVRAGWRIHKAVPSQSDYLDGTARAILTLKLSNDHVKITVVPGSTKIDPNIHHWGNVALGFVVNLLEETLPNIISAKLEVVIQRNYQSLLEEKSYLRNYLSSIKIKSSKTHISFIYPRSNRK